MENQIKDKHALIHYKNVPKLSRISSPYKMTELHDLTSVFKAPHQMEYLSKSKQQMFKQHNKIMTQKQEDKFRRTLRS